MKITHENYEVYFLDYLEGRLDVQTKAELEEFLMKNPSLNKLLENFENVTLRQENITYQNKAGLYKLEFEKSKVTEKNYSDFCIACHENILSTRKKDEFIQFSHLSHENEEEWKAFGNVYLKTDTNIVYPDKNELYHGIRIKGISKVRRIVIWGSVAASVTIGLFLYLSDTTKDNIAENAITVVRKEIPQTREYSSAKKDVVIETQKITRKRNLKIDPVSINTQTNNTINIPKVANTPELVLPIEQKNLEVAWEVKPADLTKKLNPGYKIENNSGTAALNENEEPEEIQKNGLLAVAETGVTKINQLTGTNLVLSHATDKNGKINSFSINTGFFGFYRKKSKIQ